MKSHLPLALLIWCALANSTLGAPRLVSHRAWAPNEVVSPIWVEAVVINDGKETLEGYELRLVLTPDLPSDLKWNGEGRSMLDPFELTQKIEPLEPNQRVKIAFKTPYFASAAFERRDTFLVENLAPNIRRSIRISYRLTVLQ